MSYCPLNGSQYGASVCKGRDCRLTDNQGNCLVYKALTTFIEAQDFALAVKKRELDEKMEALELQSKQLAFQIKQDKILEHFNLPTPPLSNAPMNYRKDWIT